MKIHAFLAVSLFWLCHPSFAEKRDTLVITPENIHMNKLHPGTQRWLVYFKMGKESSRTRFSIWTRTIDYFPYKGREAIRIRQEWENNDTIYHKAYSICDRKSFEPLYHETWNKGNTTTSFDFVDKTAVVNGKSIAVLTSDSIHRKQYQAFEQSLHQYKLNWHLDLETFSLLPYRDQVTFAINFYEPGYSAPKLVYYTVTGSRILPGYDGQPVDCWLLEHDDQERMKNEEKFYISKKTGEVLQLEQAFGGMFRYKVKIPFSN
ncbi:MAG: hypothetical protein KGO92_13050 [Bacteroidota bacterium]|nr:hypothetical protein [Bacteroidota bacterium]